MTEPRLYIWSGEVIDFPPRDNRSTGLARDYLTARIAAFFITINSFILLSISDYTPVIVDRGLIIIIVVCYEISQP